MKLQVSAGLEDREWLEADGLGGYASGTINGIRTRRYHSLLLVATNPPLGRVVLVNGFEAWLTTRAGTFALTSQYYAPGVLHPEGARSIDSFESDPWPRWTYRLADGSTLEHELFVTKDMPRTVLSWRLTNAAEDAILLLRPLFSGRDHHSLHHENAAFRFDAERVNGALQWKPYDGIPAFRCIANADYRHQPDWFRNFQYEVERKRGLDYREDLATPGIWRWPIGKSEAFLVLEVTSDPVLSSDNLRTEVEELRKIETTRRGQFRCSLERSADAYIVRRQQGKTIVAGYPWFTDWGRDTFISLRGLCIASGRLEDAKEILSEWTGMVSEGMLPNRFSDASEAPDYNSVDAALWYVVAVYDFLNAARRVRLRLSKVEKARFETSIGAILDRYSRGTRHGIAADTDGLLKAGEAGVQLTWMDAKVGDRVITSRIGKPVEVQALWINALKIGAEFSTRWSKPYTRALASFRKRFWNAEGGYLYDVVDVDHKPGTFDPSFRPNQILAVGGLPIALLEGSVARAVVDAVEAKLVTPIGLRSLAPGSEQYVGRYEGDVPMRDRSYHQGTVWPWLMGPFIEAWCRVRLNRKKAKEEARTKFLEPLLARVAQAGIGHLPEIADGDPPHTPRGCPFQAWSVAEALRMQTFLLTRPSTRAES